MRRIASFLLLLALLFLPACIPERVVWSPDGTRAVLLAPSGMYLMDANGAVGPLLAEGVGRALWLPDGKRILVTNYITLNSWDQIANALPDRPVDPALADKVKSALSASHGDWKQFEKLTLSIVEDDLARALLYLREKEPKLPEIAGPLWTNVVDASYSVPTCYIIDLSNSEAPVSGPILFYGLQGCMMEFRLAPGANAFAITLTSHRNDAVEALAARVSIVSFEKNAKPLQVGLGNTYIDWSPDGKSILYLRPIPISLPTPAKVGALCRQPVIGDDGRLFAPPALPQRTELVNVGFDINTRVRCMTDGKVIFSARGIWAAGPAAKLTTSPELYSVSLAAPQDVHPLIPAASAPLAGDNFQYFQASPDGTYVALPFDDGRMSLLTVSTGQLSLLQDKTIPGKKNELVTIPTWRGTHELTFVRPRPDGTPVRELVRYDVSTKEAVILSKDWDDNLRKDWLIPAPEDRTILP